MPEYLWYTLSSFVLQLSTLMIFSSYNYQHQVVNVTPLRSFLSSCLFLFYLDNLLELSDINHVFCYADNLMLIFTGKIPHIAHVAQQNSL